MNSCTHTVNSRNFRSKVLVPQVGSMYVSVTSPSVAPGLVDATRCGMPHVMLLLCKFYCIERHKYLHLRVHIVYPTPTKSLLDEKYVHDE